MNKGTIKLPLLFIGMIFIITSSANAAEFWLRAEVFQKTMPDGNLVTMWGYAECGNNFTSCGQPSSPGPILTVPSSDSQVIIHVSNNLAGLYTEPTSIMIPGQAMPTDGTNPPQVVRNIDGRVRSFVHEANQGSDTTYIWNNFKPGTYLYQSGTHLSLQVQMGLYGVIKKDFSNNQAYNSPNSIYDNEVILLFSEIDPVIHNAVAIGDYGPGKTVTSTIKYEPKYFLVNGTPYSTGAINAGNPGDRILLRLLNAGLKDHTALLQGLYMTVLSEDGNLYPYPKERYSLYLPAGKTADAIISTNNTGYYPIFDRRLFVSNQSGIPGGLIAYLNIRSTQYSLYVNKTGTGSGRVFTTSLPAGIDCGIDCSEFYNSGTEVTLSAIADPDSVFTGWSGPCSGAGICSVTMTGDVTVTANFENLLTITATAGSGGSITPSGQVSVQSGSSQTFTITPDSCHNILDVLVDGVSVGAVSSYTFNNIATNHTIEAQFIIKTYTITASAGEGGSINPSGDVLVNCGSSLGFTITPDAGYKIVGVLVDGVAMGSVGSYTFNNVVTNHTISASFALAANIGVTPTSIDFGNVKLWKNIEKVITISNTGASNLIINRVSIEGRDASLFYITGLTTPVTVLPGANKDMTVGFRSRPRGLKTATLKIYSNDPDTPIFAVPLTGNAVP